MEWPRSARISLRATPGVQGNCIYAGRAYCLDVASFGEQRVFVMALPKLESMWSLPFLFEFL